MYGRGSLVELLEEPLVQLQALSLDQLLEV
jgi:hypothetical protein